MARTTTYQSTAKRLKEVERLTLHPSGFNLESIAAIMDAAPSYVRRLQVQAGLRPDGKARSESFEETRQRATELVRQGLTNEVVSDKLGISVRTVNKARRAAGIVCKAERLPTEQEKLTAKHLLVDGASYAEVSRTIGFTTARIKRWFPGYEYTKAQSARAATMARKLNQLERLTLVEKV